MIKKKDTIDSDNILDFQSDHSLLLTPGIFD